jgi:hypothetical protein
MNQLYVLAITCILATASVMAGTFTVGAFAQSNTLVQSNTDGGDNNPDRQNYDDFQNCLDEAAGTDGFATEQQIRDCFTPIYIGTDSNDDSGNNNN